MDDSRFTRERNYLVKKSEEKEKKVVQKNLIDKLCESNINTIAEENLQQKIDILVLLSISINEVPLSSSQTVTQIEVVKEAVLPEVSKLNDSVMNNEQGDQTQKKSSKKKKMGLLLSVYLLPAITLIDGSCYKIID